jgi:hypothetical protein
MVAIGTFEWISFRIINKMPKHDIFVEYWWPLLLFYCIIGIGLNQSDHFSLVLHGRVLNAFVLENTSMRKGKALRNIRAIILVRLCRKI